MTPENILIPRLGPQCLPCKKRRTKCDSNVPGCEKCRRDGIECPGYVRGLKWSYYRGGGGRRKRARRGGEEGRRWREGEAVEDASPPETTARRSRKRGVDRSGYDGEDSTSQDMPRHADALTFLETTDRHANALTFPESLEDRECRLLLHASNWYNEYMLPQLIPAQLPFRRANHRAANWTEVPSVVRNLMLLFVKTAQVKRSGNALDAQSELCLYRGQTLLDLKTSLVEAANDPFGIVLAGIITLMGVDLQNPAFGEWNWIYHFNAAHRIIQLRGGFAKCFFSLPHSQGLLSKYMMLDIFSTSTCCTDQLSVERVRSQIRYIPIIVLREHGMLGNGQLCPQQLLQAIIHTNMLRCELRLGQETGVQGDAFTCQDVLNAIVDFDPIAWAERVCRFGLTQPLRPSDEPVSDTVDAWSTVGFCFKQATLLYSVISVHAPTQQDEMLRVRSIQKDLEAHLLRLFNIASSDADGAIGTQLWKFCLWPAAISAYVSVCWCCRSDKEVDDQLFQLSAAAATLKNDCLARCVEFTGKVAIRRKEFTGRVWRWSDGFASRSCAFVAC